MLPPFGVGLIHLTHCSPSLTVEAASGNGRRSEGSLCWTVYEASEIESTGFGQICGRRAVSLAHIGTVVGIWEEER